MKRGGLKTTAPHFMAEAEMLVDELGKYSEKRLSKLMGLSEKLATLNIQRYQDFASQPKSPAIIAYRGDVYQGLNADDLSDDDLRWSHDHIGILSGLYGVIQPLDVIQAYRLEMGTKLKIAKAKNLLEFWGEKVTQRLNEIVEKNKLAAIINFASQEYLSVLQVKTISAPFIQCDFLENKNGKPQNIGIYAKKARGLMERYVIEHRITDAAQLKQFDYAGYKLDKKLSTDTRFVFVR